MERNIVDLRCVALQVVGRLIEWRFGRQFTAVTVGLLSLVILLIAMLLLNLMQRWWGIELLFVALYGCTNGGITIARGAIAAELFGSAHLGETLGQLARPVLLHWH